MSDTSVVEKDPNVEAAVDALMGVEPPFTKQEFLDFSELGRTATYDIDLDVRAAATFLAMLQNEKLVIVDALRSGKLDDKRSQEIRAGFIAIDDLAQYIALTSPVGVPDAPATVKFSFCALDVAVLLLIMEINISALIAIGGTGLLNFVGKVYELDKNRDKRFLQFCNWVAGKSIVNDKDAKVILSKRDECNDCKCDQPCK